MGNAFLQFGARAVVKSAFPDAHITLASAMPRFFYHSGYQHRPRRKFERFRRPLHWPPPPDINDALDMMETSQYDLLVVAGMVLCQQYIDIIGKSVIQASRLGTKVIYLGAGAQQYDEDERRAFSQFLATLEPIGLLSRDDLSYEMFEDAVDVADRGIDCAFFLPDDYEPFPVRIQHYVVSTFDSTPEPPIDTGGRILVHAHHECWGPIRPMFWGKQRTLISDIPEDYLALYAGCDEVHSDRVHACVATLAYGGSARLYSETRRASLFEPLGVSEICKKLVRLDPGVLEEGKQRQIAWFRNAIVPHFPALVA